MKREHVTIFPETVCVWERQDIWWTSCWSVWPGVLSERPAFCPMCNRPIVEAPEGETLDFAEMSSADPIGPALTAKWRMN